MKKIFVTAVEVTFIWFILIWVPYRISTGQTAQNIPQKKSVLDDLEQKKQKLFEVAFANQDTVKDLIKKKPKTVIVEKIKYIKVYRTVPIYLPESEMPSYEEHLRSDTLEDDYLVPPSISYPIVPPTKKKKKFLGIF